MEHNKSKFEFRLWHGAVLAALVLAIATAALASDASPATEPNPLKAWETDQLAGATVPDGVSEATLEPLEDGALDLIPTADIPLGPNTPSIEAGSASQPVPGFSGINSPYFLYDKGPFQIADDALLLGLTDISIGLINKGAPLTTAPLAPAASTRPADCTITLEGNYICSPVPVFDDLYIAGNSTLEPGNVAIEGKLFTEEGVATPNVLSASGKLEVGSAGAENQVTGNLTFNGMTVISGDLSVVGNLSASGAIGRFTTVTSVLWANKDAAYYNGTSSGETLPQFGGTIDNGISFVSCPAGSFVVSCSGFFEDSAAVPLGGGPRQGAWIVDKKISGNTCYVRAQKEDPDPAVINFRARAMCFSPR